MSFIKRGDGQPILHLIKSSEELKEAEEKTKELLVQPDVKDIIVEKKNP